MRLGKAAKGLKYFINFFSNEHWLSPGASKNLFHDGSENKPTDLLYFWSILKMSGELPLYFADLRYDMSFLLKEF